MAIMIGSKKKDLLDGGAEGDWIDALAGADTVNGGGGGDHLMGGAGNDLLAGGDGDDVIDGGGSSSAGNWIVTQAPGITMYANQSGNDGDDRLDGGAGNDTLVVTPGDNRGSHDSLLGGSGWDTLQLMFGAREWADNETAVRAYWQALQTVPRDPSSGEVAAGTGSDTRLAVGARSNPAQLELSGLETLVVNVDGQPLTLGAAPWWLSGDDTGSTTEDVPANASGVLRFIELDVGDLPVVSTRTETGQALGSLSAQLAPASGGGPGALNWTFSLIPSPALDALPAGTIAHETYTVRLLDAQGHALERTIAIDVQGRNDAPTVAGTQVAVTMYEDFPPASGVVRASDSDTGTVLSFSGSSTSPTGRFEVDVGTGEWRFTLDPVNAQAMAMGDSVRLDQVVLVSDGAGGTAEQRVRITVNGSNDPPVFTQVDLAGSVSEDGTLGAAGRISVIDVDRGAMVTVFTDTNPNYGTLLVTSSDWRYTLDNTKAQALGEGETATEALRLVTMDQYGFGETRTLAIEVHGRNDAPRFVADTVATQIPENQIIAPRLWATDADANDHVLTSIVGGPDAALFRIGDDTNLYFVTAPDWEHPSDADHNNIYQVVLQATDDHGAWAQLAIGLQVVNVDEALAALVGVPGPDGAW